MSFTVKCFSAINQVVFVLQAVEKRKEKNLSVVGDAGQCALSVGEVTRSDL